MSETEKEMAKRKRATFGVVFLTIFLDMVGFSVIFPLFPAMLDHYLNREILLGGGILTDFVMFIQGFAFEGNNQNSSFRFETVIFGGALGSLYAILQFFFAPIWGRLSDKVGRRPVLMFTLGGTCLNVGCIPSKALLDSTEHYYNAKNHFATHGIDVSGLSLNWDNMKKRKDEVVSQTCDGVMYLMNKNQIEVYQGHGSFVDANTIQVRKADGSIENIQTKNTIIATGSEPSSLPNVPIDGKRIITSTEALSLPSVPETMLVIGGGIIGLEMSSVYARMGTKVTVIEFMDRLIPTMDLSLGKEMQRILRKLGIKFHLSHAVQQAVASDDKVVVTATNKKGDEVSFEGEYCLVAVGRKSFTDSLGLDKIGLQADERGRIPVNDQLQTTVPGVYGIGDVIRARPRRRCGD